MYVYSITTFLSFKSEVSYHWLKQMNVVGPTHN